MSTAIVRELDLEKLILKSGGHRGPEDGFCIAEAVAYIAGEPWSDHPECASPVISAIMRGLNDRMTDEERQILKPYITRLVGTAAGADVESKRRYMATQWIADAAITSLRSVGLTSKAERLEKLEPIVDATSHRAARVAFSSVASAAYKFRSEQRAQLEAKLRNLFVGKFSSAEAAVAAVAEAFVEKFATTYVEKGYWEAREFAYAYFREHLPSPAKELRAELLTSALQLVDRMIAIGQAA